MHNSGTTPLILPDKKLLPDLKPQMGFKLHATPAGVLVIAHVGDQEMPILMPIQEAAQLGVSLISVAALLQHGLVSFPGQVAVPESDTVLKP